MRVDRDGGETDPTELVVPRAPTWEGQGYTDEATLANPEDEAPVEDDAPSFNPTTHYPIQSRATKGDSDPAAPPAPDDAYLERGTVLGEYKVEDKIGEGGMGVVYSAVHPLIGKRAAVKVLKAELCRSAFNVERFIDEARVVNKIGHPNIVDVFAFGRTTDGRSYFIMEWLKGESLRARVARARLDLDEICAIMKQLARALEAAHEQGVIHRDLKPDNIFLIDVRGDAPIVKLLDFGIAKLAREEHRMERTATGAMVGTPQYIAPEQAKGYAIDHRVDIYALGGIIFELLTGRPPYVADNAMEMVAKHLMEPVPRPSSITAVPEALDDLVVKMLAKEPAGRPPLAEVMAVIERTSSLDRTNVKVIRTPVPAPAPQIDSAPIHIPTPTPPSPSLKRAEPVAALSLPHMPAERLSITDLAETIRRPGKPAKSKTMPIILGAVFLLAVAGAYVVVSSLKSEPKPQVVTPPAVEIKVEPKPEPIEQPAVKLEPPKAEPPPVPAQTDPPPKKIVKVTPKDPPAPPPPKKPKLGKLQLTIIGGSGTPKIMVDGVASGPLKELPPGLHTVIVSSKGFKTQAVTVTVHEGGTVTKGIILEPEPAKLPSDGLMEPGSLNEKK